MARLQERIAALSQEADKHLGRPWALSAEQVEVLRQALCLASWHPHLRERLAKHQYHNAYALSALISDADQNVPTSGRIAASNGRLRAVVNRLLGRPDNAQLRATFPPRQRVRRNRNRNRRKEPPSPQRGQGIRKRTGALTQEPG